MKWNELKAGQQVVLQQPLYYVDVRRMQEQDYTYMTKAELDKFVSVSHEPGLTMTLEDGALTDESGDNNIGIDLQEEINPALWLVVYD